MKKTILNSYSAPQIEFYTVAIERGFTLSEGVGLELGTMDSTSDELIFE